MLAFILLFFIALIVAYMLGLTLVSVVDKRLRNISIKVPKQNVTVNMESFTNKNQSNNQTNRNQTNDNDTELAGTFKPNTATINFADDYKTLTKEDNINTPEGVDQFRGYRLRPDLFNASSKPESQCIKNHIHENCQYGPTNYPDPAYMSPFDRNAFAKAYPKNLTIQDYINWLWTNKHNPNLDKKHITNLNKIKSKTPLRYEPNVTPPPTRDPSSSPPTASEHFTNLYKNGFPPTTYSITHPLNTNRLNTDPNVETFRPSNEEDADTMCDANTLGTPLQHKAQHGAQRPPTARALSLLTTPQPYPERFVHTSPAETHESDAYAI